MTKRDASRSRGSTRLGTYQRAAQMASREDLHAIIAERGLQVLDNSLPYIIQAARWKRQERQRREQRRESISGPSHDTTSQDSVWDPLERADTAEHLLLLADALSRLSDEDALALWRHAEGYSDDEILREWRSLGIGPEDATGDLVRKRRQRARQRVRRIMGESPPRD